MRTFLGALMVVIVSGQEVTVTGVLEDNVLLPCNCPERDKEFKWQMDEPEKTLVLTYNKTHMDTLNGRYNGRVKTFQNESNNNCSILLTNITAHDQGIYRCSFQRQMVYKKRFVNLTIAANYKVCQDSANNLKSDSSIKVFQCSVSVNYRDTELQWNLDGQLLTNSSSTNITNQYTLKAPSGLYHFNSTLSIKPPPTSEPTCDVKPKGISAIISHNCEGVLGRNIKKNPEHIVRYLKIIPIMLVLGLCLVLWCRWKSSQGLPRIDELDTYNSYC